MEPIKTFSSRTAVLPFENIDTDQIIPARFLRATTRDGFGKNLFADWRYDEFRLSPAGHVLHEIEWAGAPSVEARWLIEASDVQLTTYPRAGV